MSTRQLGLGLYALAAILLAGTAALRYARPDHVPSTQAQAEAALGQIAAREHAAWQAAGHYALFGPADADRRVALPGLDLGAAQDAFTFDAVTDEAGTLSIRAISRTEAVRAGRVTPFMATTALASAMPATTP